MRLKGIFPPMITPFKENGEVDYEAFTYNVKRRTWMASLSWGLTAKHHF